MQKPRAMDEKKEAEKEEESWTSKQKATHNTT